MTDINFFDQPDQVPQPRDQIRLENVSLEPYPDGRRVRIDLQITAFGPADRPSLDIVVRNEDGVEMASMSVIESLENSLSLTIHLRGEEEPVGTFDVEVQLFYDPGTTQDTFNTSFSLPAN